MALLTLTDVDYSVGGPLLLEKINLSIEMGERIALIGRNGVGKSTLMKLLNQEINPDDGVIRLQTGVHLARLEQEVPIGLEEQLTVFEVIADALGASGKLLKQYHNLTHSDQEIDLDMLSRVQQAIDACNGWGLEQQVEDVVSRMQLPVDALFSSLSGGMKRRVLLARALVSKPDILLLDEPTNHLDLVAIRWLEDLVSDFSGTVIFITHDRSFLKRLATRIIEIDRGQLTSWPGDYENYLRRKEERLHAEVQENARFDKKLAQEEIWIRQGIKARRTRNEGRVTALKEMRQQRAERRAQIGQVQMVASEAAASGRKIIDVKDISYAWQKDAIDIPIIQHFSTTIMRGDRVGLIGANGSGKTTLLKLMLGQLKPLIGEVQLGTQLEIAYFDQYRNQLDESMTVQENAAEGREFIEINGQRKHVIGYLQDFLFSPERARTPITKLSGGERNRLLLAKLFAKPSNMLVMDEPTNDLDLETLDLLEELLQNYSGTLLLVSHDRTFLDNVVTQVLAFDGSGHIDEFTGGYSDWLSYTEHQQRKPLPQDVKEKQAAVITITPKKKLHGQEKRTLEQLLAQIDQLEKEIATIHIDLADPVFYQKDKNLLLKTQQALTEKEQALQVMYTKWEALDNQ